MKQDVVILIIYGFLYISIIFFNSWPRWNTI